MNLASLESQFLSQHFDDGSVGFAFLRGSVNCYFQTISLHSNDTLPPSARLRSEIE